MRNVIGVSLAFMVGLLVCMTGVSFGQSWLDQPPPSWTQPPPGVSPPSSPGSIILSPSMHEGTRHNGFLDFVPVEGVEIRTSPGWQGNSEYSFVIGEVVQRMSAGIPTEGGEPVYTDWSLGSTGPLLGNVNSMEPHTFLMGNPQLDPSADGFSIAPNHWTYDQIRVRFFHFWRPQQQGPFYRYPLNEVPMTWEIFNGGGGGGGGPPGSGD